MEMIVLQTPDNCFNSNGNERREKILVLRSWKTEKRVLPQFEN